MRKYLDLLPNTFKQLVKYGLIGLLNVCIYLFLFELFMKYFNFNYKYSNAFASIISFANSIYFNRKWTFRSEKDWRRDFLYFGIIFLLCFLIQHSSIIYLVENFGWTPSLAKFAGIFAFAIPNFTLNKLITFRTKKEELEQFENE